MVQPPDSESVHVEVYGTELPNWKCGACEEAKRILRQEGIQYVFHQVVTETSETPGFKYNLAVIDELASRLNVGHRKFVYPQIFINNRSVGGLKQLRRIYP